ncbi:Ig domain-containing protein [Clostridium botulinum]|uniref:Ig-like domain-containing protein n=1 Tax=Clostridium botulinum TaxID=1491 RepID=UPI001375E43B|nr:Ig-like domain-containing protein [Clostridium botulinum]MCC5416903.1 Ig-like domain-containing protein [Clostridium botulinum]MCC5439673.1 Ig-like domain-containing protein [Clostridium botulinum]NCI21423.1 Ig domain-containing protein [Clostridium botulinum]NCI35139.1 Ig domain-containing protein [Clostridium botulinum]NCI72500.1 Ig domain-containing protein [Clostridium botulinum]
MKKKIGLIMSMVLLFVFVFSGINNAYVAHAEKNNDFVIGTHNLNNTEKNSAKVGDKINEPEKGWKRYDDTNKNISYSGNWEKGEKDGVSYKGTSMQTNKSQSTIQFNFTGSKLRLIGYADNVSYNSNVKIIIDGVAETINLPHKYNPPNAYNVLLYENINLKNCNHNVKIILLNNYINFDAVDIDENGELKPYEEDVKAESITLDKTSMDLLEGSSDKLNAKILPEDATNKKIVWSSSDEKIATVDKDGKVTAIKEGRATITAKVEGTDLTATCKVNVTKKVEENKNNAILSISLVNGATKEYDVNMQEVEKFINWFEERSNGKGSSLYSFDKKINPYKTVKEYIVHDKIASFEVREYEGTNK